MIVIPKQPPLFFSYIRVGYLLYLSLFLFVLESWFYGYKLDFAIQHESLLSIGFWVWCFMFSFIHIFLVIMDGWSRFQNYKRAKDQFFLYGFQQRIAIAYIGSKCQRMAALTAADELGMGDELKDFYDDCGVKWFHYVPYFMVKEPLFFFKKSFWSRTFLEQKYYAKYDFQQLYETSAV